MRRSEEREQAFILLFEGMFSEVDPNQTLEIYSENVGEVSVWAKAVYQGVTEQKETIDKVIERYSKGWKINRISKVDLSVLRLAVYEIMCLDDIPDSVSINEAVELAKKYAGIEDASFINGILGSYVRGKE